MRKIAASFLGLACLLRAEVRPMTLRQAVETALRQNPDIALSRLEEESARQAVRVAKDPFTPRLTVGSGLAYTNGFPMSIEGSAPSIVQARATQDLFNRPQSYAVARAKEDARGAALGVAGKRDEVAYRTASLYLDADQATAETALAIALGLSADERVRPMAEERRAPALPPSEEQAIQAAMESNQELRKLESQIVSKGLELRGANAARWPKMDLVAQYGMLAKFNNYADFFQKFQRNNVQLGVSFQLPLFTGSGVSAQAAQTQIAISHLRIELGNSRNRLASDLQQSFRDVKKAETAAEVARLDLDVAREQLSMNLAQMQEGRTTLRQVEDCL